VFTCLWHDIVAQETTHALLDGLHRRFVEPTHPDVWALPQAFADVVALFQHFSHPGVLRHRIARTGGDLERQNLLAELAYQFGQAIGRYGALRSALGRADPVTKEWIRETPDPQKILQTSEPHARGAILVAALFEAFVTIYKRRIADLLRIASSGSGVLHPDLVERLAQEASKAAGYVLHMCIRALDYCPPLDVDFGDTLRALITADANLVASDRFSYRLALIEAFRRRGIYPPDVRSLSEESLVLHAPCEVEQKALGGVFGSPERLAQLVPEWGLTTSQADIYDRAEKSPAMLHGWFVTPEGRAAAGAAHLVLDEKAPQAFYRTCRGVPMFEVHSVRPARRIGPPGQTVTEPVVEMTQRRRGYYDPELQERVDGARSSPPQPDFIFCGGYTLLVDPVTAQVRYCVFKRILSENRLARTRRFLTGDEEPSLQATHFRDPRRTFFQRMVARAQRVEGEAGVEPFALLHRSFESEEML